MWKSSMVEGCLVFIWKYCCIKGVIFFDFFLVFVFLVKGIWFDEEVNIFKLMWVFGGFNGKYCSVLIIILMFKNKYFGIDWN